jgi:hypothetical protein
MPTWNWGQPLDGIIQVAYIVEDIGAAMKNFGSRLNLGPWFLFEHFEFQWIKYRGLPCELDLTVALANSGHMMFELIQQNDAQPSVYREILDKRGYGFHHWAVAARPENYEAVLARYQLQGFALSLEAMVSIGARAAYVDTSAELGGMIEVIEVTPAVEGLFTHIHQASVGWDGSAAVRTPGRPPV